MADNQTQESYQRTPTEYSYKNRILAMLDDINDTYQNASYRVQIAVYEGRVDRELMKTLYVYTSQVITLYKVLKPKIELAKAKSDKFGELEGLDEYILGIDELKGGFDIDDAFILFKIFNIYEDLIRELCETLGYTADNEVKK